MREPSAAEEIAREIARTRQRLSRSLARLDREYALRHLVVRAGRLARSVEEPELSQALRQDTIPAAMVVLGLGWLSLTAHREGASGLGVLLGAFTRLQRVGEELGLLPRRPSPDPLTSTTSADRIGRG